MRRLPGSHPANVKNRSSKHLSWLCGKTPVMKTLSNEALAQFQCEDAVRERQRRNKKNDKKAAK